MRIECIRRGLDLVKSNLQSGALSVLDHRCIGPHGLFFAAKFRLKIEPPVHATGWHVRVELKRMPFNIEIMFRCGLQSTIQMGFANIAPRANRVRNNIQFRHALAL